ncbi:similar to Saccharomyces cerevisiae YGL025C PGD1 Subunit of the RNA polymerase II mediator complex [Maudiozyma saulgeensis]|uniref:Similar to Saccharomyces cerevisiae YGL025C PGD1 Subunit of the RNA polymerase II mediator complex n=1 Tax=Maudiozyma saulgeensis TaxID=1789683 RepID=A0A1X7R5Q2_9SACH|nr:similar to Saccharomyces cerevisiae YGL025C PGD1 Subunit of the RNA polymerase II mediator complex [Kazachstania saulgeensis]
MTNVGAGNETESGTAVESILTLHMKLEELERRLAQNPQGKEQLALTLSTTRESILPIRLELNNFIHMVSNIADDKNGITNQEKFHNVRTMLLKLHTSIQSLSQRFQELSPLFGTVPEYTTEYKSKEYQPLETLTPTNIPQTPAVNDPSNKATSGNTATSNTTATNTNNITSTGAPATTTTTTATKKGRGSAASLKSPPTAANTPTTGTATPATTSTNASTTTAKKPRKPRQKKSVSSAKNTPAATHATTTNTNSVVATPLSATTMNPTLSVPPQLMTGMIPGNIVGMSPTNTMMNMAPQMQPQMQFNSNNMNNRQTGNTPGPQGQLSPQNNTITPANILSMGSNNNITNNSNLVSNNSNNNNNNNNNQGPNAMNDFGNLDLNNIDLSSLNMDFL